MYVAYYFVKYIVSSLRIGVMFHYSTHICQASSSVNIYPVELINYLKTETFGTENQLHLKGLLGFRVSFCSKGNLGLKSGIRTIGVQPFLQGAVILNDSLLHLLPTDPVTSARTVYHPICVKTFGYNDHKTIKIWCRSSSIRLVARIERALEINHPVQLSGHRWRPRDDKCFSSCQLARGLSFKCLLLPRGSKDRQETWGWPFPSWSVYVGVGVRGGFLPKASLFPKPACLGNNIHTSAEPSVAHLCAHPLSFLQAVEAIAGACAWAGTCHHSFLPPPPALRFPEPTLAQPPG